MISLLSAGFTAGLTLFLLRALSPNEYGVFALSMSVSALVVLPSNLGISHAAARFVAESRDSPGVVLDVISDALRLKLAVAALFSVALAATAGPIADAYNTPDLEWPIRILSLAVFGESMLQLFDQVAEAQGKVAGYLRVVAAESVVETVTSVVLVLAGLGVSGALAGRAGGYLFAAVLAFMLLARALGQRPALRGRTAGRMGDIARYGSALLIIDGVFVAFTQIDVLLTGAVLGVTAAGLFQAPTRLTIFLTYAGAAVASGVAPRVAQGKDGPDVDAFEGAITRLMLLQGLFMAPLLVWAEPITNLVIGSEYADSAPVLRGLAPYVFLVAISPVLSRGVTYLGEARRRIPIAIATLAVNVVLDLLLLPRVGIVAGAIGTAVAYSVYVAGHLWLCRKLMGTRLRPLAETFLRVLVAVAAMSAVLLLCGTGTVSLPVLLGGGLVASLVYLAALVAVRALTPAEVRAGVAWIGARLPRPRRT